MILSAAMMCLALNVYHESRGEPIKGQYAVAAVTMNRANGDASKICDEVFRPYQFSWTNRLLKLPKKKRQGYAFKEKLKDEKAWKQSVEIAKLTLLGFIEWKNVTHFHTKYVRPSWANSKEFILVAVIGDHRFYRQRA